MDTLASPRSFLRQTRQARQEGALRLFADLQLLEGRYQDLTISTCSNPRGYVVCLQAHGNADISHGSTFTSSVTHGQILAIARPSHVVWHPTSPGSRCIIASGGTAFSLCFQPHLHAAVRLDGLHPMTLLLRACLEKLRTFRPTYDPAITQRLAEALADMVDTAIDEATQSSSTRKFLAKLGRAESHLDDPEFDPPALAKACGLTLRSLQKKFKLLNSTPRRWILDRRLERIRRKLDDPSLGHLTTQKIAAQGGLQDFSHFIHVFKDAFGVPPGRYRR